MQAFSDLVGRIYDAAVTPDGWPDALDGVRRFLDSEVAILASFDAFDADSWGWQHAVGFQPQYLRTYREKYMAMNPWMDLVATLGSGETTYVSAHDGYEAIRRSEFYLEWLKPQRLLDAAVLMIDKSVTAVSTVVVSRTEDQGFFDEGSLERFSLIYPHLRRSASIGRIIRSAEAKAETLADALDALSAGLFLLDSSARIVHANRAGAEMIAAKSPVVSVRGRLEAAEEGALSPRRILEKIRGPGPDAALGASRALFADGKAFMLHAIALDARRRDALSAEKRAAALVLVKDANPVTAAAVAATAERYRLTPQEARVLRMVVDAGGIPLAADALNLSPSTVRTHIARIYDKTGVRSQGRLIKLLAEMETSLRP
jgi:DNA-binding CsgD family transcriptional regulator